MTAPTDIYTLSLHDALPISPPVAKKIPKIDVVHGDRRQDPYAWLRHQDAPDVLPYLTAENAYTDLGLKPTAAFQETLYAEMLGRIKEDDTTVPYRRGGHFYYTRTEKGKQYPILCRKHASLDAPEEITLDLNRLAEGHAFLALRSEERRVGKEWRAGRAASLGKEKGSDGSWKA